MQATATGAQSALESGGPAAARIGELWNVMLVAGTIVTVLVLIGLAWAIWRPRAAGMIPEADRPADARGESLNDESGGRGHEGTGRPRSERSGVRVMVWAGIVVPAVILGALLAFTMRVLDDISLPSHMLAARDAPPAAGELTLQVTGRQYWWEVEYLDAVPERRFETANEIHIPVGRRVIVRLVADDVIHSFWVPGLAGKMDLVPGRTNVTFIEASRPGVWRGQCAEFCGVQHALMAFTVVAEAQEAFDAWAAQQRSTASEPVDSSSRADRDVFLASGCALCHAVRGTTARGEAGPDLTHLASRMTLAAGTLPNARGHRDGWVANPQAIKPGSLMPSVPLTPDELHAIVRYLGTLR